MEANVKARRLNVHAAAPALFRQSARQTICKTCGKETAKQTEKQTNDSDSMPGSAVW